MLIDAIEKYAAERLLHPVGNDSDQAVDGFFGHSKACTFG